MEIEVADRDSALNLDHDTRGVPGTPSITQTIFQKIQDALVFVPDLTFVGQSAGARMLPNPNVLIEYGYAVAKLGHERLVPVMNTAFGDVNETTLPFDMRHLRHPITFNLPEDAGVDQRRDVRAQLVKQFTVAIRLILESKGIATIEEEKFISPWSDNQKEFLAVPDRTLVNRSEGMFRDHPQMLVPETSCVVFRMMPILPVLPFKYPSDVERAMRVSHLPPFGGGSHSFEANRYGAVAFSFASDGRVLAFSQVHLNKEIWSADYHYLDRDHQSKFDGDPGFGYIPWLAIYRDLRQLLPACLKFYESQEMHVPMRAILGLFGIEQYRLALGADYIEKFGGTYHGKDLVIDRSIMDASEFDGLASSMISEVFQAFGVPAPKELLNENANSSAQ
jgi:hypothetical protein